MRWDELSGGEKKEKMEKTYERIKDLPACDFFHEFRKDHPEVTVSILMFYKEAEEFLKSQEGME